jgi:hypothetical protein
MITKRKRPGLVFISNSYLMIQTIKMKEIKNTSTVNQDDHFAIYKSIRTFPLSNFIRLVVDGEDTAVVKYGIPPWQAIKAAKENLIDHFDKKWKNSDQVIRVFLEYETTRWQITPNLAEVMGLIEAAKSGEQVSIGDINISVPAWINKGLFMHRKFDEGDPEMLEKDIKNCDVRVREVAALLSIRSKWISALQSKHEKGYSPEYIEAVLSVVFGLSLEKINYDMTVYQFCESADAFINYSRSLNNILYAKEKK